ncbi:MAG: hypothetical protein SGARI_004454 [Bacillariaceae sp.]
MQLDAIVKRLDGLEGENLELKLRCEDLEDENVELRDMVKKLLDIQGQQGIVPNRQRPENDNAAVHHASSVQDNGRRADTGFVTAAEMLSRARSNEQTEGTASAFKPIAPHHQSTSTAAATATPGHASMNADEDLVATQSPPVRRATISATTAAAFEAHSRAMQNQKMPSAKPSPVDDTRSKQVFAKSPQDAGDRTKIRPENNETTRKLVAFLNENRWAELLEFLRTEPTAATLHFLIGNRVPTTTLHRAISGTGQPKIRCQIMELDQY